MVKVEGNKGNLFDIIGKSSYRNRHEQEILSLILSYSDLFYPLTLGVESHCCLRFFLTVHHELTIYEGWNFNSGNYLFTTDTK